MASNSKDFLPAIPFQNYFTRIAPEYSHWTGRSTEALMAETLRTASQNDPIVSQDSMIMDNASGPCIATAAIISHLGQEPANILATDFNEGMIEAANQRIANECWKNVKADLMDSHDLKIPDNTFTVCISNINISTHADPLRCVREMHRTLRANGKLVVTIWKRFAVQDLIDRARQLVRPGAERLKSPGQPFFQDGYLRDMVVEAGFVEVKQRCVGIATDGKDLEGFRDFMLSDLTQMMRKDLSAEDCAKWPTAIGQAIQEEIGRSGACRSEAWVVTARKAER